MGYAVYPVCTIAGDRPSTLFLSVNMIISRSPYRISFFGGGTDYPAWCRGNGGAVLATSIDKYCYL
jgi:hypothetical protein